jgi:hypothetical protein
VVPVQSGAQVNAQACGLQKVLQQFQWDRQACYTLMSNPGKIYECGGGFVLSPISHLLHVPT